MILLINIFFQVVIKTTVNFTVVLLYLDKHDACVSEGIHY